MRDYKVKVKLILKTNFLQSGKNKKNIELKTDKLINNAIKKNKVLSSLFNDEYKLQFDIKQIKNNSKK